MTITDGRGGHALALTPLREPQRQPWYRRMDWWHWIGTIVVGGVAGYFVSYWADVREPYIIPSQCEWNQVQFTGADGPECMDVDKFVDWWSSTPVHVGG